MELIENHMILNTPDAPWNQPDAQEAMPEEKAEHEAAEADEKRRYDAADALRQLADLLEENPFMALPYEGFGDSRMLFMTHSPKEFQATVRAFGNGQKSDGGDTLDFMPDFPIRITVFGFTSGICPRREVTKTIPAVVIPARPATSEVVIPARAETVVEYVCDPSFLSVGKGVA
jgi:hypothetical protein